MQLQLALILLALVMLRGTSLRLRMALQQVKRTASTLSSLSTFASSTQNTLLDLLVCEEGAAGKDQFMPRQVYHAHFTPCKTEPPSDPSFVIASENCAHMLGLDLESVSEDEFARAFAGLDAVPGLDQGYATVYGCHVYGQWFGQLGDGRAVNLGEVENSGQRFEMQLKGGGRTPFSRGFDGKAVLRSCIREFLASEAMHHAGVPSTRALCIVATNQGIRRAWYVGATSETMRRGTYEGRMARPSGGGFPPDRLQVEPGAIMCRVSPSFLRVAQFELFAKRGEIAELVRLADYCCFREFPHLLTDSSLAIAPRTQTLDASLVSRKPVPWTCGHPRRYIELYRCVCRAAARLVAEWLRVGYVQGNMNSDNMLLGGRTLDYGPFGFMEKYDPLYQPFTSDMDGKFAFMRQPTAMLVNMVTLAESFAFLIEAKCREAGIDTDEAAKLQAELSAVGEKEFPDMFHTEFCETRRRKLGLVKFRDEDNVLWKDLDMLMYKAGIDGGGGIDFTILFRELISVAKDSDNMTPEEALAVLQQAFYEPEKDGGPQIDVAEWTGWLARYIERLRLDDAAGDKNSRTNCLEEMRAANPKFIVRNWMAIEAYEAAERGDYSVLQEIHQLIQRPCEEQPGPAEKWYCRTPAYARQMPGAKFLS